MKIELFGDWCPGSLNVQTDFMCETGLINIEGPILKDDFKFEQHKKPKMGPHLYSQTTPKFCEQPIYSLANNHIMDYGIEGLLTTVESLTSKKAEFTGYKVASENKGMVVFQIKTGETIAIIANAERQYGFANNGAPGYIPTSDDIFTLINSARKLADYVIISNHGGDEKSLLPSQERRDKLRKYIEAGADVVWGHHAHVPQGWEFYESGLICYGMGNFATDPKLITHAELGRYALTVKVNLKNLQKSEFGITFQYKHGEELIISRIPIDSRIYDGYFKIVNNIIQDDDLLAKYYDMYSERIVRSFYSKIVPIFKYSFWTRYVGRSVISCLKNRGKNRYREVNKLLQDHVSECESHRNMVDYFLNRKSLILRNSHDEMEKIEARLISFRFIK